MANNSMTLIESLPHLEFLVHPYGRPSPAEIAVQVPLATDAHEDAALEFDFLLALHLLGPAQVQEVVDIDLGFFFHFSPLGVSGCFLLVQLLDLLDLLVFDGLWIERHLPKFFGLGPRLVPIEDADGRFPGAGCAAASGVVDDVEGAYRFRLFRILNPHQQNYKLSHPRSKFVLLLRTRQVLVLLACLEDMSPLQLQIIFRFAGTALRHPLIYK